MKNPLGRIVGVGLWKALGIQFLGDFSPVSKVEGNFQKGVFGDT